jgi:hypothetical protein
VGFCGVRDLLVADFRVDVGVFSGNPSYSSFKKSLYFRMAAMSALACADHGWRVNGLLKGTFGSP